ncbi:hypothetical protein E2C01_098079 [Portunus trituberculatus]|uniref:Uncharacterized protein n=1 Tax=Portunus trituberculatus TaxID=210409 RepID=A0A5B7JWV2_PORTR|nr:hypothetical protein [Portunus trituberculatus]
MAVTHIEGGAGGGEVEGVGGASVLQRGLKEEVLWQTTAVPGCTAHSDGGASSLSRRAVLGRLGFACRREREKSVCNTENDAKHGSVWHYFTIDLRTASNDS